MSIRISRMAFVAAVASTLMQISGGGPTLGLIDRVIIAAVSPRAPERVGSIAPAESETIDLARAFDIGVMEDEFDAR
jgi:hypothetical protein